MYSTLLVLHSFVRWLVLVSLAYALFRGYRGWRGNRMFTKHDHLVRLTTATLVQIQLLLGLTLYFISPIVEYFLHHFKVAVHERQLRFFGMEHITMMLIAITVITVGSIRAKRKSTDHDKFKTMALWFSVGLLLILMSIPWGFPPLVDRPYFRGF